MLKLDPSFNVMRTLNIAKVGAYTKIGQVAVLPKRSRQVGERISAREEVIPILANERVRREDRVLVEDMRPTGSDIAGIDEDSLVLPRGRLVELVRLLEPGTRIIQVEMKHVLRMRLKVDAVKYVFAIPYIVDCSELRRVQKPAGPEPAGGYEITEPLAARGEIEACTSGPERAIRSSKVASWFQAEATPRGDVDDQCRFVTKLGRWNPVDCLQRLHRFDRNLIRE